MSRQSNVAALLGVVAVSIVFGMIVGGRLNAPTVMHAAPPAATAAFPAATLAPERTVALPDFSEIASDTLPAVVGVQNTTVDKTGEGDAEGDESTPDDQLFRFFFGPQPRRGHPEVTPRQPQPQRRVSSGSGFIITPDGYILTNNHVVEHATKLQVTLDTGEKYEADVVGTDPMIDLGLIKIDTKGKKLPTLPLGDSDSLKVGQWVMAIGNPFSLERTVTVGVVSGKKRQVDTGTTTVPGLANFIQTDAAINFGNSGGPLIDGQGRVIGINTLIQRGELAEGIGFAIPINEARRAAEELRAGGSVKRGYLGISMNGTGITEKARAYYKLPDTNGVIVSGVNKGPAADAGLKANDVIRKIDGTPVKDNQDLLAMIASRKPGETVKLEVLRGDETMKIDVKLATRPVTFDAEGKEADSKPDDDATAPTSAEGLGIKVQAVPSSLRQQLQLDADAPGVLIVSVDPESDAAEEGLSPRMVVTSIDGRPLKSVAEWNRIVNGLKPGETVKLDLDLGRRKEIVFLTVPKPKSK
jgi:serine protease Do